MTQRTIKQSPKIGTITHAEAKRAVEAVCGDSVAITSKDLIRKSLQPRPMQGVNFKKLYECTNYGPECLDCRYMVESAVDSYRCNILGSCPASSISPEINRRVMRSIGLVFGENKLA